MNPIWGIDLGGTKIEGVVLESREHPEVLRRLRIPTEADKGYLHVLKQIHRLTEVLVSEVGIKPASIGIGTPGTLDPQSRTLKNSNTVCLNGMPVLDDLQEILGIPIQIANDANCFAVAEALLGNVKEQMPEARVVFGVIVGTGVGGGLVVDGKVIGGRQGIGGEWGHNFLDEDGGTCYCGHEGCVETLISGPALERYYHSITHNRVSLKEIVRGHRAGSDTAATLTIARLTGYFGRAIAAVINIVDPDAVVIGGGVGNIDELYSEGVAEAARWVFNSRLDTRFFKPKLGDSAGVFGAALLVS
jgi:predicted NBD/HSP70 family sugar kinase